MEDFRFSRDRYVFASMPSMILVGDSAEQSRNRQIVSFCNELSLYNVLLKDLVKFQLQERERNIALNVAYYIYNNDELLDITINKKDLLILKLSKFTRIKPNNLERLRDYILAYFIILVNPNYRYIQDCLNIKLKEDNRVISINDKNKNMHKGLAIKLFRRSAYILTAKGEFLKIKTNADARVGEVCEGREKRFLGNLKIHLSILLVILIMIGSGIIIDYRRTQSIIIVEMTSTIKLHINRLNKVIYAYSPTEKGQEFIDNNNIINMDIDDVMAEAFQYASKNEMIDKSKKVLITVNGQPLKYGALAKMDKFVSDNNISIVINNSGSQQKVPKYSTETEDDEENEK